MTAVDAELYRSTNTFVSRMHRPDDTEDEYQDDEFRMYEQRPSTSRRIRPAPSIIAASRTWSGTDSQASEDDKR